MVTAGVGRIRGRHARIRAGATQPRKGGYTVSVFMNITLKVTIWWEERHPDVVIKICTGDRRFVND